MTRKWAVVGTVIAIFAVAVFSLWLEKPVLTQAVAETVTTSINEHLNGTVSFSSLDISLSGRAVLTQPVIADKAGKTVITSDRIDVAVNPWKAVRLAASGGNVIESVETISIEAPRVNLWENREKQWNVASLVKTSDSKSDTGFRAAVRLHDGTVQATLGDGTTIVANDCEGTLDFSSYPAIYGDVTATVDGHALSASGHYTSARQYDGTIKADAVKAAYVSQFIPDTVAVTVTDGSIEHVKAHLSQGHNGFFLSGEADISGGAAQAQGYMLEALQGHVQLSTDDVSLTGVSGQVNGQAFSLQGTIKTNTDSPVFNLAVDVPGADLSALLPGSDLPVSGTAGAKVTVWGTVDDLSVAGTVHVPEASVQGVTLQNGTADFSYDHKQAVIDSFAADVAGGHITGKASYNQDNGNYEGSVEADAIQLEALPQMPAAVLGSLSGSALFQGNTGTGQINASGRFSADSLSYNGIEAQQASGEFSYVDGVLTVPQAVASVRGGTVQVSGVYSEAGGTDATLAVTDLPLDMFSSFATVPLSGTVTAYGHVSGAAPDWEFTFTAQQGTVMDVPFDTITGTLRGSSLHIEIPGVTWKYVDGTQQARGMVDLSTRDIRLSVQTSHMRLERFLPLAGKGDLPLTGWLDNQVDLEGTLDDLKASGSIHLTDGSAYGYLYKEVSTAYSLKNGVVTISNGNIYAYQSHISFYGTAGDTLAIHVDSPDIDIARALPKEKLQRSGTLGISAYIGGTPSSPTAVGSVTAKNLVINHIPITELKGDFGYYGGIVRLTDFHFKQNDGVYDANGSWNPSSGWIMTRASVHDGDIESAIKLFNLPLQKISGKIDGNVSIDGTVKNPRGKIAGQITQAVMDGYSVEPADIDIQLEDGVIKVNKLMLNVDQGVLAAQGTYALDGPVNLQVGSRNFSSRILLDVLGRSDIPLDTRIDSAANITGTSYLPQADISLQLNGGTMNGISFTNVFGLANIRDNIIHINQAYISREPYKASAYGSIPVKALTGNRDSQESMDVTFRLDNAGLDILTFLTPLVKSASGAINGSIDVTGTLAAPRMKGSITTHDGMIQFRDLKDPLQGLDGTLTLDGSKLTLSANGTMDKKKSKKQGNFTLQADATWDGWQLNGYEGTLVLNKLGIDNTYFKGPLSGKLSLSKEGDLPKLAGIVQIDNATVNVPLLLTMSDSSTDMAMDLTVALGDKVRLYNPALYDVIVKGSANFRGTLAHPQTSGRYEAVKGTIRYLDTRFVLSKGEADFSQLDTLMPYLDIEGHSRVGQYNIMLTVKGPVENMHMLLRSQPPLSRQQIVSLITLRNGGDRKSSSLSNDDIASLVGTGVRMTLNSMGITSELERFLSLDMLNVTAGSLNVNERITNANKNYYNIEMGKYLFNDFMITGAFGLNHNDNRIGFRYELSTHFGIEGWSSDGQRYIGGQYRYTFF